MKITWGFSTMQLTLHLELNADKWVIAFLVVY